jgi:DnaJ homolog subfamily C member 7
LVPHPPSLTQYLQANDDCDTALSLDSTNSKAYFRKVTALKGLGRLDDALTCMQTGLTLDPTNTTALNELQALEQLKIRFVEAVTLIKTHKRFTLGLTKVDQLIREMGSGSRELQLLRLECLLEAGRLEECLNHSNALMKVLANGGNDLELLRIRGRCLYRMGDLENSVKHYQQALRCDPDNTIIRQEYRSIKEVDGCKERGNTAYKEGNYDEALQEWQRCIELDPNNKLLNSKIHSNRANALAKLRRSFLFSLDLT